MKTESQIKRKLKQVAFRHRQKFVRNGLQVKPCNCLHNSCVKLKSNDRIHQIRTCSYKDQKVDWSQKICDESFGGLKQAQLCPYFDQKNTPGDLKKEFDQSIGLDGSEVSSHEVAHKYPDIMALYWVLGPPNTVEEKDATTQTQESDNQEFLLFMSEFLDTDASNS